MKKQRQPIRLLHTWIRGAIGHDFVIKHYRYGVVKTKFPDMTKIIASAQQRKCRNLFKEAVDYANKVYADPVKKKEWTNKSRKKHRVFNYIIKEYMLAAKEAATKRQEIGTIIIRKCFPHLLGAALSSRVQHCHPERKRGTSPQKLCPPERSEEHPRKSFVLPSAARNVAPTEP